jgi:hypothetical protein
MLFKENDFDSYSKIELESRNLFDRSSYHEFVELMESIDNESPNSFVMEWRIKSEVSIFESLNSPRKDETTIQTIRDLLGFRYWIRCERFSEYPSKMISLISQILKTVGYQYNLNYIRLFNSADHPYQLVSLHFEIDKISIEILVMNHMFRSAFNRTLYPMWEGHMKGRFDVTDIPFPFNKGDEKYLWGVVCNALHDDSGILPFLDYSCRCGENCLYRQQFLEVDFDDIRERVEEIAIKYGGDFVFR